MSQSPSNFEDYPDSRDIREGLEYFQREESETDEISLPPKPPKPRSVSTDPKLLAELVSSDKALWERAWFEFNERYKYYIFAAGMRVGGRPDMAQELVYTVLQRVQKKIKTYDRNKGKFRTWLWTVSQNVMRDELRKNRRIKDKLEAFQAQPATSGGSSDFIRSILDNKEDELSFNSLTGRALEQLAKTFKGKPQNLEVFRKYCIEFAAVEEVAAEFKISPGRVWSVKSQLFPEFTQALKTVLREEGRL